MILDRRTVLRSLLGALAAPVIVQASSLMPISTILDGGDGYWLQIGDMKLVYLVFYSQRSPEIVRWSKIMDPHDDWSAEFPNRKHLMAN